LRLVEALAQTAAIAIENATLASENTRLLEEARRQREMVVAMEATRDFTSSLIQAEIFQQIVEKARQLCGCDLSYFAAYDKLDGVARIRLLSGAETRQLLSVTPQPGSQAAGRVLANWRNR
jgi:ethanolamine utilization protein EutQ (cupin superfamily)